MLQHLGDALLLFGHVGVGLAHDANQVCHQFVEKRGLFAQLVTVADGSAHDAALHVTAPFVAGHHAVAHQKRGRADVVGNHAQALVLHVSAASFPRSRFDQRVENIDFVVAVDVLQNRSQTLQPHTRVHARCREFDQAAVGLHVKLHEHVVPNLDKTVTVFLWATWWAAGDVRAVVVKNLAARAARSRISHHPEVVRSVFFTFVVANADDAVGWQANLVVPNVVGFLVINVDRGQQLFCRQTVYLGQQLPAPFERVALEIVAKTPVAHHFKESMVTRRVAHVFQVIVFTTRTQASLHAGGTHVGALVQPQKHVFELHHARVGEHQRRVITRHQRARRHDGVPLGGVKVEEGLADVGDGEFGLNGW